MKLTDIDFQDAFSKDIQCWNLVDEFSTGIEVDDDVYFEMSTGTFNLRNSPHLDIEVRLV